MGEITDPSYLATEHSKHRSRYGLATLDLSIIRLLVWEHNDRNVRREDVMDVVRFTEALTYTAQGHDDVTARRLQGGGASAADFVTVGHSSFPDGAVVPMDIGAVGKIYVVTEGSITIEQEDGKLHVLHRWDSIFVAAGEARAVRNESGATASIIVITPPTS